MLLDTGWGTACTLVTEALPLCSWGSVGMKGRQELREDSTILHGVLIITLRKHDEKIESRRRTWEQNSPYSVHSGKSAE